MSETREPTAGGGHSNSTAAGGTPGVLSYSSPGYGLLSGSSPLLRVGGAMGIAACVIGLLAFITACAGLNKVMALSMIPVGLSLPGLIVTLVAAVKDKHLIAEDTHVLQALFVNIVGLIGGLIEMAAWLHWPIFYQ